MYNTRTFLCALCIDEDTLTKHINTCTTHINTNMCLVCTLHCANTETCASQMSSKVSNCAFTQSCKFWETVSSCPSHNRSEIRGDCLLHEGEPRQFHVQFSPICALRVTLNSFCNRHCCACMQGTTTGIPSYSLPTQVLPKQPLQGTYVACLCLICLSWTMF